MLRKIQEKYEPDVWVFDNDGTLYNNPRDLEEVVVELMEQYIADYFRTSIESAKEKRHNLLKKHKTTYTLLALRNEGIDENDFIQNTYLAIRPENFGVCKNSILRNTLLSLSEEKYVLTNNPSQFAEMILNSLGIADLFRDVYGVQEMGYIQKPNPKAFERFFKFIKEGKTITFVDDEQENVDIAQKLGFLAILAD